MKIHPTTLQFLLAINEHNTRKYFATVKDLYIQIRDSLQEIAGELLKEANKHHDWFEDTKARECLYRIYRDARRLKEWDQIYKQNFWILIGPWWRKTQLPAYYLHIQPWNKSFFAAGLYWPNKEQLENLRRYLAKHWDLYKKELAKKTIKNSFINVPLATLKKPPKWFSEDNRHIDIIKMKQHMIKTPITDKEIVEMDVNQYFKKQVDILGNWMELLSEWLMYSGK